MGFNSETYALTTGAATNATWTSGWIPIGICTSIGVEVVLTGTSSPVSTWGADVTSDPRDIVRLGIADADLFPGATALTLTSAMTAQNPAGDAANINFLFQFDPAPRAKWFRFKLTRSSGGSASLLLKVAATTYGGAP